MAEQVFTVIWVAMGAAIFFGMIAQLRLFSVARDLSRIADSLEDIVLRDQASQLDRQELHEDSE